MKKFGTWLLALGLLCGGLSVYAANGDVIGTVYSTDILAYINGRPVPSYNIGGRTAVLAEDLADSSYGISFGYDDTRRLLTLDLQYTEPSPSAARRAGYWARSMKPISGSCSTERKFRAITLADGPLSALRLRAKPPEARMRPMAIRTTCAAMSGTRGRAPLNCAPFSTPCPPRSGKPKDCPIPAPEISCMQRIGLWSSGAAA